MSCRIASRLPRLDEMPPGPKVMPATQHDVLGWRRGSRTLHKPGWVGEAETPPNARMPPNFRASQRARARSVSPGVSGMVTNWARTGRFFTDADRRSSGRGQPRRPGNRLRNRDATGVTGRGFGDQIDCRGRDPSAEPSAVTASRSPSARTRTLLRWPGRAARSGFLVPARPDRGRAGRRNRLIGRSETTIKSWQGYPRTRQHLQRPRHRGSAVRQEPSTRRPAASVGRRRQRPGSHACSGQLADQRNQNTEG